MRHTALAFSIILALLLSSGVRADHADSIFLKDGRTFTNVEFSIDHTYKIVLISTDEGKISVSFTNIIRITDSNGDDVTEDYLEEYAPSLAYPATEVEADPAQTTRRQPVLRPFRIGLRLGSNLSIPSGDWWYGTRKGIGFDGDLIVSIGRKQCLRASLSKSGIRHDLDELIGPVPVLEDNLSFTTWRYFVAYEYYNWPGFRQGRNVRYFMYTGLGAISYQLNGRAIYLDPATDEYYVLFGTGDSESEFMMTYGVGMTVMASRSFGFEFAASLDMVFVGSSDDSQNSTVMTDANVFDLKIGIVFFGR